LPEKFFIVIEDLAMNLKLLNVIAGVIMTPTIVFSIEAEKPNILIFLVDDLGWKDLSCYGSQYFETPAIDKLADNGVRFTNAYSACTVCSPSRAALMTGKYPARLHLTDWIPGHIIPGAKLDIPAWTMFLIPSETTLAEILNENGYQTASIGKWHLGEDSIYWPENKGFKINIGGYSKGAPDNYFSPYNNPRMEDGPTGEYLTDRLTDESIGFIRNNYKNPFFLYVSHYAVHAPFQAKQELIEKYRKKTDPDNPLANPVYAAMVESMDQSMSKIIEELEKLNISSRTYIFFLSDNGGLHPRATSNYPLREGKGTAYEGGVRTPLIISGPKIPKGMIIKDPAITMDVFATILDIANIQQNVPKIDGISLMASIKGKKKKMERPLFWHYPHYHSQGATPYSSVRLNQWKFYYFYEDGHTELYDLDADISEVTDLSGRYPEKAGELHQLLLTWLKETNAQLPPTDAIIDNHKK